MEGARHPAVALQFANVADVDKHRIVTARKFDRVVHRQGFNLAFRGLAQGLVSSRDVLRHRFVSELQPCWQSRQNHSSAPLSAARRSGMREVGPVPLRYAMPIRTAIAATTRIAVEAAITVTTCSCRSVYVPASPRSTDAG